MSLVQPLKKAKAEMGAVLNSDRQSQVLGTGQGKTLLPLPRAGQMCWPLLAHAPQPSGLAQGP